MAVYKASIEKMALWILEAATMESAAVEGATVAAGGECRWLSMDDEARGRYGPTPKGSAVVFRGSFEAAEAFRRARPDACPGVVGEAQALRCAAYYPLFGEAMLNAGHTFVPLGKLREEWPALQARFGAAPFVRPDSGAKAFAGGVVEDLDRFEERERIYLQAMDASELCLVARPHRLAAEFRMVVVDGKVVAGSRYRLAGKKDVAKEVPRAVWDFSHGLVANRRPAAAFMLDVATVEGGRLAVVEVNSFSCSDLYAADPSAVIDAVETWLREPLLDGA